MTNQQAILIVRALVETVREAGPNGAPSSVMYAAFMAAGLPLEVYEHMIDMLVKGGLFKRNGHLIQYNDPTIS